MAQNKLAGTGKSKSYKNLSAESRAKKLAYDKKYQKKPSAVKKRVETNKANREAGTYGKMTAMGKDRSHTKSGGLVLESRKANRGRNGRDGKSTKK